MLTKQEQDALDNAPEGATKYYIHKGNTYYGGLSYLPLADLRKKQGKTVWDAVNYFKGELMNYTAGETQIFYNEGTEYSVGSHGQLVCTIEEFNQCVKGMSEGDCEAHWGLYGVHDKQLLTIENSDYSFYEPLKENKISKEKRMKVEYVEVDTKKEGGKFWEVARDLAEKDDCIYRKGSNDFLPVTRYDILLSEYKSFGLYRKVETEITWQDELSDWASKSGANISVDTNNNLFCSGWIGHNKLIEMCHLVSSMNK